MREKEYNIVAFNRLYKEMDDIYSDIARHIGISDSAFTIFYIICELGDGCLQKDICQTYYVTKQTINSSIRKLEREGYLYLEQGKGHDKHIHLTPKGQEFVQKNILPVQQMEHEAFQALTAGERKELLRLTEKYVENLRNLENQHVFDSGGSV
ncbi:MAG: MarR family winged helix-turn-helix transcriptional regulator [Ruminococcus sp.]|jgi:DNA-binding MarR family transcriptional regulator